MENYKPNSHKSKEQKAQPEKKVEKIVSGNVKTKKKNELRKFADVFIAEDIANVRSYLVSDVLIPTVRNVLWDIVTNTASMFLFGERGRSGKGNTVASKVSYQRFYDNRSQNDRNRYNASRAKTNYSYDDIIFDNRVDAEDVLDSLCDLIDTYRMARVADLYELVGITGSHTDNKYGWMDLHSAYVDRIREGYVIKLPRALPLD